MSNITSFKEMEKVVNTSIVSLIKEAQIRFPDLSFNKDLKEIIIGNGKTKKNKKGNGYRYANTITIELDENNYPEFLNFYSIDESIENSCIIISATQEEHRPFSFTIFRNMVNAGSVNAYFNKIFTDPIFIN